MLPVATEQGRPRPHKSRVTRPVLRHLHWLHSVWQIDPVNPSMLREAMGEVHTASFPENLVRRLIDLYSEGGDLVLDPFAGSGTTSYVADCLGRRSVGYELEAGYVEMISRRCAGKARIYCKSSERMEELPDGSVALCVTSPPYLRLRRYSADSRNIGNHDNPYPALRRVFAEVARVLRPGGFFCVNVADVPQGGGRLTTFPYDVLNLCLSVGLLFVNSIVWDKGVTLRSGIRSVRQNHEYVWVLKKPNGVPRWQ